MILIPLTAIATYAPFRMLELYPATKVVLYLVTMPLGFWFFFRAVWCAMVPGAREPRLHDMHQEGTT